MTTVTQSTSATIVALLGTINATASAVAKTVDSAASSVDMLDRYVQRAKSRQFDTHAVEDKHWRRNLILNAGKAQEKIETQIDKEYSADPARATRFNSIIQELEAMFTVTQP